MAQTSSINEDKSSDELRMEVEQTQGRLEGILRSLEGRLDFRSLLHRAQDALSDSVKRSQTVETVKDNPAASLLTAGGIAAAAAGVAWLTARARSPKVPSAERAPTTGYEAEEFAIEGGTDVTTGETTGVPVEGMEVSATREEPWTGEGVEPSATDRTKEALSSAKGKMKQKAESAKDKARQMKERASEKISGARESAKERAHHLRESAEYRAQRAKQRAQEGYREHPLTGGAIAAAAGVLVGALLPSTRAEDRVMGSQRDRIMGKARQTGESIAQKAKDVGSAAAGAAQEQTQGEGTVSEKISRAVESGAEAGKEQAQQEGLTPEQLREKAEREGRKPDESTGETGRFAA